MGCGTDLLYANNHMAMLRRTHPAQWLKFMSKGMAAEIRNIQIAKKNGQMSIIDVYEAKDLLEIRPCVFDRIDRLVWDDETWEEDAPDFDPEVA